MRGRLFGADHHTGVLHEGEPQRRDHHQLQRHGDGKVAHEATVSDLHTPTCIKDRANRARR